MFRQTTYLLLLTGLLLSMSGCASYYRKNRKFNEYYSKGDLEKAEQVLANDKKGPKRKNSVLYYLNSGVVAFMLGKSEESNRYFEQALSASEDAEKNYLNEAAALVTNPNVLPYKGEDFELLMVHYYMAMNYMQMRKFDAALVEARRMNEKLGRLNDKYKGENKYKSDAFIHLLMGLIYDADGDYNNAFIAYRNAYNVYDSEYSKLFNITAPEQLKQDILRTAHLSGLPSEVSYYEKQFGRKFVHSPMRDSGEVVFFWLNGLGPVKEQWSVDFIIQRQANGMVNFFNAQLGWNFSFYHDPKDSAFNSVEFVRIALPRYIERPQAYTHAKLSWQGREQRLTEVQDINAIAFQSLKDRLLRDLGNAMMRLALKKAAEYSLRKQNQNAGAALSLLNYVTEQADTRNWQTLPHSLYYTRLRLPAGEQKVELVQQDKHNGRTTNSTFTYNIVAGRTQFHSYHNLTSLPPRIMYFY